MMHTCAFNGDIGRLSQLLVRCPEELFESHPRLLYCQHVIPLSNHHPKLARLVDYYVDNVDCLQLRV